jgi:hypothetical protein
MKKRAGREKDRGDIYFLGAALRRTGEAAAGGVTMEHKVRS